MTRETTTTVSARGAGPADAGGLADLFHEAYKHSSHPCKNPAFILEGFHKGDIWSIGEAEGRVIACQALVRRTWNNSWEVGRGVTRPGQLERFIPGISTKVLNERLRKLLDYRLITRAEIAGKVPRTDYALTPTGTKLSTIIENIRDLDEEHGARRIMNQLKIIGLQMVRGRPGGHRPWSDAARAA